MFGIAQSRLAIAVTYAKEPQQFGRPIGANQVIKHMLAEVQVEIEFLRPILLPAAAMLTNADDLSRAHISHARLRAADLVDRATRTAVQVHGAMGYSWETDVHLYLRRGLILLRVPIGFAMGIVGVGGFGLVVGSVAQILGGIHLVNSVR